MTIILAILYFTIAAFTLGGYVGAAIERGERVDFSDSFSMGVLAAFWSGLLGAFIYVWLTDKSK